MTKYEGEPKFRGRQSLASGTVTSRPYTLTGSAVTGLPVNTSTTSTTNPAICSDRPGNGEWLICLSLSSTLQPISIAMPTASLCITPG